jgi:homogentisate 1,2-dioxygenase
MRYLSLGELPRKRHAQFRNGGDRLLVEEVMGYEGFSGNESILYHHGSPCRIAGVGPLRPLVREEWVPPAHVHRLADAGGVDGGGDPVAGRRVLMFNDDLEVSVCKPTVSYEGFYRNGEGDEVLYIHRGGGVLRTIFGAVEFRAKDYLVIPRGTTHTFELGGDAGEQFWLCFHTPGEIETPQRYRNRYGQLLEHAPFSQRDFRGPASLETIDEAGSYQLTVRVRGGLQEYELDRHPFDVVGWDGYVWPYAFNASDFEPRTGRFHLPPPTHQTFQGQGFVICTFAPRPLDWDPEAVPLPYHHSNIQSEEVMFYADGDYSARRGVSVGCITLHPSGLTPLWEAHDKPEYAYSWNPDHVAGAPTNGAAPEPHRHVTVTPPSA